MKTNVFLAAILVLGVLITSCEKDELFVTPSAKVTTSGISATGLTSLDVSSLFSVYVSFSETEETVFVEANENLHHLIRISQIGNKLKVGLENNTRIDGEPVLNLYVKTSSLEKVKAEGAVKVEFENLLVSEQFDIELSGASQFNGNVEAVDLAAQIEGASKLELYGSSNSFIIKAEGASKMSGFDFETNHLEANLEGGCEISLTVHQKMKVDARGSSKVYYRGNGIVESQNLKDASEIIKLD